MLRWINLFLFTSTFGIQIINYYQMKDQDLKSYLEGVEKEFHLIEEDRRELLQELAAYLAEQRIAESTLLPLTFICTHNSRRSHLGQIWTAIAADYYGVSNHFSYYSGGTEVTAFNERAVNALQRAGVDIVCTLNTENPEYSVTFSKGLSPLKCFSKKYDDPFNPKVGFVAVMTCSDAEKNCPIVFGATYRIGIPYDDPKLSDGLPNESQVYDERCQQIAREMMYMINHYVSQF